jgi:hypothetical protein
MQTEKWLEKRSNSESAMDRLYNRFDGMYPGLWSAKFSSADQIENWRQAWAEAFYEDGITFDDILTGIRACRKSHQFPPTLPEFIQCCRPLIDYDKAFYEAVDQIGVRRRPVFKNLGGVIIQEYGRDKWSHPAIYWAAIAMGSDLDNHEYYKIKSHWHYELDKALSGELNEVPQNTNLIPETLSTKKEFSLEEQKNVDEMFKKLHSMFED